MLVEAAHSAIRVRGPLRAFFERIGGGGFRVEFSDKSDDGRFLLAAAAPA